MSSRMLADRYELLEKIGDGGMAVVYKAKDKLLNRFVAVKILKPEFSSNSKFLESFRRESQAAASLNHPNIVNVYDVGREGNINFIVMELITGKTLSSIISENGPLASSRAINIAKQIAMALSLAHKNNIIHRDVKPHNILITENGVAKITDFGIAKAVSNATMVGATGTIMGSVHYFSPEQARGGYIDAKTDIYSLGIVLFEMVTGTIPFDGENPVSVALMHMNNEMPRPSMINPNIPPMLEAVIMKATDKYQVNRFIDADEMYQALERASFSMLGIHGDGSEYMRPEISSVNSRPVPPPISDQGRIAEVEGDEDMDQKSGAKGSNGKKKKVKLNKLKVAAIILALLCAIPVSQLILGAIEGFGNPKEIMVPDVVGLDYEEATETLEAEGLKVEMGDSVVSEEYEEGQVVSQDPESGMKVKKKAVITLNICKVSNKEGEVPDVTERTLKDAEYILELNGYKVGKVTTEDSDSPLDTVIEQDPEGNEKAKAGSKVNLVVSNGKLAKDESAVPNLRGLTLEKAKKSLEDANLTIGSASEENTDAYPEGQVFWQQYATGEMLAKGTAVNVKVSAGPSVPAGPKSVSLTVDYGAAKNDMFYITVIVTDSTGTKTLLSGESRFKDSGSEVITFSGQGTGKVQVLFDNEVVLTKNVDFNAGTVN